MFRKYMLPVFALAGIIFAVWTVIQGNKPPLMAQPVTQPAKAPFTSYVAGAAIVEARTENIAIGTPVGDIVTDVYVQVGQRVNKGDPLFRLRDIVTTATLEVRKSAVAAARAQVAAAATKVASSRAKLDKLKAMPRQEDIPPAEARLAEARASLDDAKNQLRYWEDVSDKRAISQEELDRRRWAVRVSETKLAAAEAELLQLKAGAWKADIAIAEADIRAAESDVATAQTAVAQAEAAVKEADAEIERRTVRAPVDGTVLQVKVRAGEYAMTGVLATPLMVLGNIDTLVARVDVDENDAWRLAPDSPAVAAVRGNPSLKTPLTFLRVEPYVIPKRSLTGDSTERVDTRVLQVLYTFDPKNIPVRVGQQMDVFIEAPPITAETRPAVTPSVEGAKQ
ncbi:MAG: HlyD family secretion protein [Tepidisphaerales bacterium]